MDKITLIEFYKSVSKILEEYRHEQIGLKVTHKELTKLNELAKSSGLDANISLDILGRIEELDDERSYEPAYDYSSCEDDDVTSDSNDSSYEEDND